MREIAQIIERKANHAAYINHKVRHLLAPFVLFDAGRVKGKNSLMIDWHPHSGVATVTMPYDAKLIHQDSMGHKGTIEDQGLQWMASGKGIWHKEIYEASHEQQDIGIMQLWVLLPPDEEVASSRYFNLKNNDIIQTGNTRILLGAFQGKQACHKINQDISYLDINLKAGESWYFQHKTQSRGFIYPRTGSLNIGGIQLNTEHLGLLEENTQELKVTAITDSQFVLAASAPWPHKIVHQYGQMHTNMLALDLASDEIRHQAKQLQQAGSLAFSSLFKQ